ncbi:MAG: DUF3631 domain-containing protein [Actinobacteria bacterium]|nr:DUF3631 domain-containing protein [Actinomycetota bacterium]
MSVITLSSRRVDVADLTNESLDVVGEVFDRYVVFPSPEARDAVVLWALHAHVFRSFDTTPRLSLRSRDPGSGKSRVLEVLEHLVPNPLLAVHITPGVLWRKLEHGSPTILLDEADTIFGRVGSGSSHRQLRGILNAGYRRGATVPRCVGAEDVKEFSVFGPVALAGLGRLPETVASRSVEILMRPRKPSDPDVHPFRLRFAAAQLRRASTICETWSMQAAAPLRVAMPDLPVINRDADVWEPLVAIADLAGPLWADRARRACKALTERKERSIGPALLADIRTVFGEEKVVPTAELLDRLRALPDSQWRYGTFTGRAMAKVLTEYGISSQAVRHEGEVARGYKREAFAEAWGRYAETN